MDSNSTQFCRLCLQISDNVVNIFDTFENSTIVSILANHFTFQVDKNDISTEWLCQMCWIHTKNFHIFYKRIEFCQRNHCESTDLIKDDLIIKQEQTCNPEEEALDLNIVKWEETQLTVVDMQMGYENSSDYNVNCDEMKTMKTSDDEDQTSIEKPRNDDIGDSNFTGIQWLSPKIERKCYDSRSLSEKDKLDAQIRELFNMKCEICSDVVQFETLLKARQHYRRVHKIKGYLMCCGKKFSKRHKILAHIDHHVNPDAYRCEQCGKHLRDKITLKIHISNHVPLDSREYKCSLCSSSFTQPGILKRHELNKHASKNGEIFPCDKCNKKFQSKLLLTCHNRHVHETSLKYVCEICARGFKTKSLLQSHVECAHPTTPRPKAQCNICSAWLKDEYGLQKHLKLHGRQKKDIVNCPICKKVCKDKKLLGSHIRYSHGERQHQCVLCDKAFMTAKGLKEHVATHTGENLYNCQYCEKKFKSNGNLYSHRKKAHIAELTRGISEHIKLKGKLTEC